MTPALLSKWRLVKQHESDVSNGYPSYENNEYPYVSSCCSTRQPRGCSDANRVENETQGGSGRSSYESSVASLGTSSVERTLATGSSLATGYEPAQSHVSMLTVFLILTLHVLGMFFAFIGTLLQIIRWVYSFRWCHPRTILFVVIFGASFAYLAPQDVERQFTALLKLLSDPYSSVDYINPDVIRRILVGLMLLPTLLEMRSLGFLSHAVAESGFFYNALAGTVLSTVMLHRFKFLLKSPRDCLLRTVHVLYGIALVCCLSRADLHRLPALAGPFFWSTGSLLLSYRGDDNGFGRALRHALRLTLRDVLANVGETVSQDEMLQLAMLRWIVDYWAYRPADTPTGSASATRTSTSERTSSSVDPTRASASERTGASSEAQSTPHHELQWEELQPMLDMTTHQMVEEVPSHTDHFGLGALRFTPGPRPSTFPSSARQEENGSLRNLRNMLASLDVDERAKPAVMAYKQAVTSFPPSRRAAVWISIIRRCPASLMLLYLYLAGSDLALACTLTLLPFSVMEALRILKWAEACQQTLGPLDTEEVGTNDVVVNLITIPVDMDPMCILLSGDSYDPLRPPALLQVWANVCGSVVALEAGLTATRCAQTTAVAADFAGNLMSLAQFGVEVSQHGWLHGVTVMIQEVMHMHATGGDTRYASAAVNAVRNGSIVARNVQALAEEDNPVVQPILGVLSALVGHGWLWGKDEPRQESSVTIEEISVAEEPATSVTHDAVVKDDKEKAELEPSVAQEAVESENDGSVKSSTPSRETPSIESLLKTTIPRVVDDLSELMELIADAFEKDLITEVSFTCVAHCTWSWLYFSSLPFTCTQCFSTGRKECIYGNASCHRSTQQSRPDKATVEQMERSLRNLLESSEMEAASRVESQADNELSQSSNQGGDGSPGTPAHRSGIMTVDIDEDDQFEAIQDSQKPKEAHISMNNFSQEQHSSKLMAGSLEARLSATPTASADIESDAVCDTAHAAYEATSASTSARTRTADESTEGIETRAHGDDWTKWVGGGMAVLGVVAGSIAIANASKREEDGNRQSNSSRAQSSVYIEELDDDDSTDEWVTVSSSNAR